MAKKLNKWEDGKVVKTKSQTTVGTQKYIEESTGEIKEFTVIEKNITSDFNFHKIWLQDVLNILDSFGNKKILVITHLLKIMRNEDNTFSGSYREIAEACEVSLPTVSLVMNELIDGDVIKKVATGTYQFNPSLVVKGGSEKRRNLLIKYTYGDDAKQISNARKVVTQHSIFEDIEAADESSAEVQL